MSNSALLNTILATLCLVLHSSQGSAQTTEAKPSAGAAPAQAGDKVGGSGENVPPQSWLVRDPTTGRLYQQELVTRTVPTTQWEVRPVPTTVYEPRQVVTSVPTQQVTYTPTTQYVMQARVKGWWNPLAQPVQAYEFVPVTTWQPRTHTVQQPVTSTQWVAKQQTVYVPQAVQRNQTQQQIVSREIPQPYGGYPTRGYVPGNPPALIPPPATMMAAQQNPMMTRPLISMPLLAGQSSNPWNSAWGSRPNYPAANNYAAGGGYPAPGSYPTVAGVASSGGFSNTLRPITSSFAPTYSAPLQTASSAGSQVARDPTQSGMSATVLR